MDETHIARELTTIAPTSSPAPPRLNSSQYEAHLSLDSALNVEMKFPVIPVMSMGLDVNDLAALPDQATATM